MSQKGMMRFLAMMIRRSLVTTIAGWVILGLLVDGYMRPCGAAEMEPSPSSIRVETIGVMPFLKGRCDSDIGKTLDCHQGQLSFDPEGLLPRSTQILTEYLQEALQKRYGDRVVPLAKVRGVYEGLPGRQKGDTPRTVAQELGKALQANVMVVGTVWRYRERVGGAGGVQSPTAVAFAIYLVDVARGKMVWTGKFVESPQSLADNILEVRPFVKRGARWLSADQLAQYGVKEVLKDFPL